MRQVNEIEVHFQDLGLILGLFQIKGTHDLLDLTLHGNFVVTRYVLDELLCDGGAAARRIAREILDRALRGGEQIHAAVIPETVILNGDKGVHQILRDLRIRHPDTVFAAVEPLILQFHHVSRLGIHIIYRGGVGRGAAEIIKLLHVGVDIILHVIDKHAAHNRACDQRDQKDGQKNAQKNRQNLPKNLARDTDCFADLGSPVRFLLCLTFLIRHTNPCLSVARRQTAREQDKMALSYHLFLNAV